MDSTDARLLDLLQQGVPLVSRPFAELAGRLGSTERDVICRVERLKSDYIIRQIGAIFDSAALGYTSALVAFQVNEPAIDSVAREVSKHPGVSHCYARDADYNLWFTIAVPPENDLDTDIAVLAKADGVGDCLILPALKVFKIGVFLRMSDDPQAIGPSAASGRAEPAELSELDRAAIRALQSDLPLIEHPFAELALTAGVDESALLDRARGYQERGLMRRFAAVLRHRRAGYSANAMVCWKIEPERIDDTGRQLAADPSVSHCYERPTSARWPYALYTMVHAKSEAELNEAIERLVAVARSEYRVLRSVREYKKSRMSYFTND